MKKYSVSCDRGIEFILEVCDDNYKLTAKADGKVKGRLDQETVKYALYKLKQEMNSEILDNVGVDLIIDESIDEICEDVFCGTKTTFKLNSVTFNGFPQLGNCCFSYQRELKNVVWKKLEEENCIIPEGYCIPDYCFFECDSLEKMLVPFPYIGSMAYSKCKSFSDISFYQEDVDNPYIGYSAFYACNFNKFKFPEKIKVCASLVLAGNKNLESVVFPSNLKIIQDGVCSRCFNLVIDKLPDSVELIGDSALLGGALGTDLPANLKRLGERAIASEFNGDTRKTNIITLPKSLEEAKQFALCGLKPKQINVFCNINDFNIVNVFGKDTFENNDGEVLTIVADNKEKLVEIINQIYASGVAAYSKNVKFIYLDEFNEEHEFEFKGDYRLEDNYGISFDEKIEKAIVKLINGGSLEETVDKYKLGKVIYSIYKDCHQYKVAMLLDGNCLVNPPIDSRYYYEPEELLKKVDKDYAGVKQLERKLKW